MVKQSKNLKNIFGTIYNFKAILIVLVFSLFIFGSSSILAKEILVEDLAGEITSFFPVIEGYIIEVKGEKIFIDLGRKAGVKEGIEFLCLREGEEFTHPITGVIIGRFEGKLGSLKVSEVEDNYSIGRILLKFSKEDIKRGDKIRISSAKIPVLLPPGRSNEAYFRGIVERLEKNNRFDLVPEDSIKAILVKLGILSFDGLTSAQIKKLGDELNIDAIIIPEIASIDGEDIIQVKILSAKTASQMAMFFSNLDSLDSKELAVLNKGFALNTDDTDQKIIGMKDKFNDIPQNGILSASVLSQRLHMAIRFIVIGDITGDGKEEISLTDGQNIFVFSWSKNELKQICAIEGKPFENHISFDIADINDNGRSEIYVSNVQKDSLRSFVLEWQGNSLKKIWEKVPIFLKIMQVFPGEEILLGQGFGIKDPFDDRIFTYKWENNGYTKAERMELPFNVNIFNIAMADLDNDGEMELIFLKDRLIIYKKGKEMWRSEVEYGGKAEFFEHKVNGGISTQEERTRIYLSSHYIIQDINNNNKPDILVIKNISSTGTLFPHSRFYRKGEVCLIEWNGISYSEIWTSRNLDAYLTDIGIGDVNMDDEDELIISMVLIEGLGKFWRKKVSRVLFF